MDHCIDSGHIAPWVREIMERIPAYWGISPSGTGLRAIARAKMPPGGRKQALVEVYDAARYATVTGHHLGSGEGVQDCQTKIEALHHPVFEARAKPNVARPAGNGHALEGDDADLLECALNAATRVRPWGC